MGYKLLGDFLCVPDGEIYPVTIPAGKDCPTELEGHALALGLIEVPKPAKGKTARAEEKAEAARLADEAEAARLAELANGGSA